MVRGQVALDQGVGYQRGVPHRREARLQAELVVALDGERLELLDLPEDQGVVVGIAEQAQGEHRVGYRRVDAAQAARHRQPLLEPQARGLDRSLAERPWREALPDLQTIVDGYEEALPEQTPPRERLGHAGEA